MRQIALPFLAAVALLACSTPQLPPTGELAAPLGNGGSGGTGGASPSSSTAGDAGACPDLCATQIEPRKAKSPVPGPYTGIPVTACSDDADCYAVAGCRHTKCNTDCGFCMFMDMYPCSVDHCPGHNSGCQTDADCTPSPFYNGIECMEGKCVIQYDPASGYECEGPGDGYQEP